MLGFIIQFLKFLVLLLLFYRSFILSWRLWTWSINLLLFNIHIQFPRVLFFLLIWFYLFLTLILFIKLIDICCLHRRFFKLLGLTILIKLKTYFRGIKFNSRFLLLHLVAFNLRNFQKFIIAIICLLEWL